MKSSEGLSGIKCDTLLVKRQVEDMQSLHLLGIGKGPFTICEGEYDTKVSTSSFKHFFLSYSVINMIRDSNMSLPIHFRLVVVDLHSKL